MQLGVVVIQVCMLTTHQIQLVRLFLVHIEKYFNFINKKYGNNKNIR
jgi:hypothetical protein